MIKVGAVGFPRIFGDYEYGETIGNAFGGNNAARLRGSRFFNRNGYFFEAWSEAARRLGSGHVGLYVKYTVLHAEGTLDISGSTISGAPAPFSNGFTADFDRRYWTAGGRLSLFFSSAGAF
jgi:hypothetical protein